MQDLEADDDNYKADADDQVLKIMDAHGLNRKMAEHVKKLMAEQSIDENTAVEIVEDQS
jgi:hypothetical protein